MPQSLLAFHWHHHFKPRSPAVLNRALPIQLAAKLRNSPCHNRQTKPRSLRLRREKWLQDFLVHTFRHSRPVVFHRKQKSLTICTTTHPHVAAASTRFKSIHHKIRQNLADGLRARRQLGSTRLYFDIKRDTTPLRFMPQNSTNFFR